MKVFEIQAVWIEQDKIGYKICIETNNRINQVERAVADKRWAQILRPHG